MWGEARDAIRKPTVALPGAAAARGDPFPGGKGMPDNFTYLFYVILFYFNDASTPKKEFQNGISANLGAKEGLRTRLLPLASNFPWGQGENGW